MSRVLTLIEDFDPAELERIHKEAIASVSPGVRKSIPKEIAEFASNFSKIADLSVQTEKPLDVSIFKKMTSLLAASAAYGSPPAERLKLVQTSLHEQYKKQVFEQDAETQLLQVLLLAKQDNLTGSYEAILELEEVIRAVADWKVNAPDLEKVGEVQAKIGALKDKLIEKTYIELAEVILPDISVKPVPLQSKDKDIVEEEPQAGAKKKIAFVDIDGTLIINKGDLNLVLVEKLKEYDEVVLFTQRSKYLQSSAVYRKLALIPEDPVPAYATIEHVLLGLQAHGLHSVKVSTSIDSAFGEPTGYFDGETDSLREFERKMYEFGLRGRASPDSEELQVQKYEYVRPHLEVEDDKVRTYLGVTASKDTKEGQSQEYYPKNKVEQYRQLHEHLKHEYPEGIEVDVFDDSNANLKEIIEAQDIPQEDKPFVYLVAYPGISLLPMSLPLANVEGLKREDVKELKLKNLALLVAYFVEVKKLNSTSDQAVEIDEAVDAIINTIFIIAESDDLIVKISAIQSHLDKLIELGDLVLVPPSSFTLTDLNLAITGSEQQSPAQHLLDLIKKENELFYVTADGNDKKIDLTIIGEKVVAPYHLEPLKAEATQKYREFYEFLMATPLTTENIPSIKAKIASLFSMWKTLHARNVALTGLPIESSKSDLFNGTTDKFFTENQIDIFALYKLRALNDILVDQAENLSIETQQEEKITASQYYNNITRHIGKAEERLAKIGAEELGVAEGEVSAYLEKNQEPILEHMLFEAILDDDSDENAKQKKISEFFPIVEARERLYKRFYVYQLQTFLMDHFGLQERDNTVILKAIAASQGIKDEEGILRFVEANKNKFISAFELAFMHKLVSEAKLADIPGLVKGHFPEKQTRDMFNVRFYNYQLENAYLVSDLQVELELGSQIQARADVIYKKKYEPTVPGSYGDWVLKEYEGDEDMINRAIAGGIITVIEDEAFFQKEMHPELVRTAKDKAHNDAVIESQAAIEKSTVQISQQFILNIKEIIEKTSWEASLIRKFARKIGLGTEVVAGVPLPSNVAKIYKECLRAEANKDWNGQFDKIAQIGVKASGNHFEFFGLAKTDVKAKAFYNRFREAREKKEKLETKIRSKL